MKLYAYENYDGDKGIIIADSWEEAVEIYQKEYPKAILFENYHKPGTAIMEEIDYIESGKLYCTFPRQRKEIMEYKVRIHTARMETRYGTDVASVIDDPIFPRKYDDIINELMQKLNYTENDDSDDCYDYPGRCDEVGAYFDYDGYIDFNIPESIVEHIMKGE